MTFAVLNTGAKIPKIGFGTYSMIRSVLEEALDFAIFTGYRHIDTAVSYENEQIIGDVLNDNIKKGRIKRKDMFLTSKLPGAYLHPKDAREALERSLHKLKTPYLDMWLIHYPFGLKNRGDGTLRPKDSEGNPEFEDYDLNLAWNAMEEGFRNKQALALGVSNFSINQMNKIVAHSKVPISNVQLECHAYNQQVNLRKYCHAKGIVVTAYSPLGCPDYPRRDTSAPTLLQDNLVNDIALTIKKTSAQVLIRYLLELGTIPIPKSSQKQRIAENFNVFNFELIEEHKKSLATINNNVKHFNFKWAENHPEFQGHEF